MIVAGKDGMNLHRLALAACTTLSALLLARGASADEAPRPLDQRDVGAWDHMEFSMGFLSERRSYQGANFAPSGAEAVPGASTLVDPFRRAPFQATQLNGLRYELRLVAAYVRMTAGIDIPFASYRVSDATGVYNVGGTNRTVSVRSLGVSDIHFGIGAEYPLGPVAPFVDVLGAMRWVTAGMAIDSARQDYEARVFGLGVRGGLRLHVRRWLFVSAAAQVGLLGDLRWGGDLNVGFAFGKF